MISKLKKMGLAKNGFHIKRREFVIYFMHLFFNQKKNRTFRTLYQD
ncbi:hypothetical protein MJH12_06935 [bacterium]|nr:hypothetical protein [bacterium]